MKRESAWWRRQKQLTQAVGFLLAAAAVPFCLMLLALALVTLDGGYRPVRYTGSIDPVRASFGLFLTLAAAAFLLWTAAALEQLPLRKGHARIFGVAMPLAVAVFSGVLGIGILVMPAGQFAAPVPTPVAAVMGAAGVLVFTGFFYLVGQASLEAMRSREFTRIAAAIFMLIVAGGVLAVSVIGELRVLAEMFRNHQP